jgi:hypothetical protein
VAAAALLPRALAWLDEVAASNAGEGWEAAASDVGAVQVAFTTHSLKAPGFINP